MYGWYFYNHCKRAHVYYINSWFYFSYQFLIFHKYLHPYIWIKRIHIFQTLNAAVFNVKSDNVEYPCSISMPSPYPLVSLPFGWLMSTDKSQRSPLSLFYWPFGLLSAGNFLLGCFHGGLSFSRCSISQALGLLQVSLKPCYPSVLASCCLKKKWFRSLKQYFMSLPVHALNQVRCSDTKISWLVL